MNTRVRIEKDRRRSQELLCDIACGDYFSYDDQDYIKVECWNDVPAYVCCWMIGGSKQVNLDYDCRVMRYTSATLKLSMEVKDER